MTQTTKSSQKGFTLLEVLAATALFIIACSAMFSLLNTSQRRYQTESQVLDSFQDARLALDQIERDANDSGYPPYNNFAALPANCLPVPTICQSYVNSPVAWSPNYVAAPCLIGTAGGGTCATPGDFDVIFEENNGAGAINWIRYRLNGTTLLRGTALKGGPGTDPAGATLGNLAPFIVNVMNSAPAAQIATFRASYPSMFPGGNPVPIFQYYCPNPAGAPATILCQNAGGSNSPQNVVDVEITLILQTSQNDAQTKAPRLVELNGRGHRVNPN